MRWKGAFLAALVLATITGGCTGARNVDIPPSRGISADIDASHQTNPTIMRGLRPRSEPYDCFPWQLDGRR